MTFYNTYFVVAPFRFDRVEPLVPCVFALKYEKLDNYLPLMCQLQRASTLLPVEQNGMIAAIVYSMQNRTDFDNCWLESVQEKILIKVIPHKLFNLALCILIKLSHHISVHKYNPTFADRRKQDNSSCGKSW